MKIAILIRIPCVKLSKCNKCIIRQCISNAYDNDNSLTCYKLAYFRSSFNCDIMSSIEKSKPNVLLNEPIIDTRLN